MNISVTSVIESPLSSRQPEETRDESTLKVTPVGSLCDKPVKQWSCSENNTIPTSRRHHQCHHHRKNQNLQKRRQYLFFQDCSPAEDSKNLMALQVLYSGRSGSDLWNSQLLLISTLTAQDFFNLDFYNLDFFALDFYYLDFTQGSQWISTILMSTIWMSRISSRKWNSELPVFSTLPGEDF